jgi:hypothetical protein
MPQPYLVPVRPSCSRSTHNSGVSGSASNCRTAPFTFKLAMTLLFDRRKVLQPAASDSPSTRGQQKARCETDAASLLYRHSWR